jgi:crotonobetaine/carnitine-CoA ligase
MVGSKRVIDLVRRYREAFSAPDRTVVQMLLRAARQFGDMPFIKAPGGSFTFAEAPQLVGARAGAFSAAGVRRGDVVAVMCDNHLDFALTFLAAGWAGCTILPVNTACKGPQIEEFLRRSAAVLLVIHENFLKTLDLVDLSDLPVRDVWVLGSGQLSRASNPLRTDPGRGAHVEPAEARPGDSLLLLFTSGTTGPAKGVVCPNAQFFWWGVHTANQLQLKNGDILHTALPLFHVNALNTLFQALLVGCTVVLEERFSASRFYARLNESAATVTFVLGAMVPILLARAPADEEQTHRVLRALGPGVPDHLREEFERRTGIQLINGFGSTETNFVIGWQFGQPRGDGMGRLLDGFQARVVDCEDAPVPHGTPGELVLRATEPHAFMTEYLGMPEATLTATRNMWFHTGDRVVRREDGTFHFVDRIKDVIRRRGENISSFEIESILNAHPGIAVAAAYPVASELAEDEVMIAVQLTGGHVLTEREIIEYCVPRMPYFAVPRFVMMVPELPRTPTGKLEKYKLQAIGRGAGSWDREEHGIKVTR